MSSLQNQISGNHYKRCKIQPVEFIHANAIPHLEACVIRYVVRHRHKNKADDLRKARHYIDMLIEMEYGEKGDPSHQPAPETVSDEGICGRCSGTNIVWYADSPLWNATVRMADGRDEYPFLCPVCFAELAEERGHAPSGIWSLKLDQYQPAPETVVCQDWHSAVREMRTGVPNSAMSAVIAPTPSTPGWMDKAAETLVEKRIDSDEEIYQWGGGRWQISNDKTFCWNARECAWNESTLTPSQLRQDGTRVTN